jgi:transcriptional regulator with XRE-family HTH domain
MCDDDLQIVGTTSDCLIQQLTDEEEGKDFAIGYFKSGFMSSAVNTLFYMRRQAGLTRAQVAERLNTTEATVAYLESDFDGEISLRQYVEFALACGMVPHDITFAPLESVINYAIARPKTLYTQVNHQEWLKANS